MECISLQALSTLSHISQGDLRRTITYLQVIGSLFNGHYCWVFLLSYMDHQSLTGPNNDLLQGAARLYGSSISSKDLISVSGVSCILF